MRQSVISIYEYLGKKSYSPEPIQEIIFRQPYHNLGIAYSFNFSKSFFAPFSTCQLSVSNPSPEMINAFRFDPAKPLERPKIEIRAGETDYRLINTGFLPILKNKLPLIYTGHPYFFTENKFPGGKTLNVQLSDTDAPDRTERTSKSLGVNTPVLIAIESLLGNMDYDIQGIASSLGQLKLEHTIYNNNLNIMSQVLPELARIYKFHYFRTADGQLKFVMAGDKEDGDKSISVSPETGLIEYPTQINWCFWNIKTFFGRPAVFYPGGWMTVDMTGSKAIIQSFGKGGIKDVFGEKAGMVIDAKYNWNDTTAEINYTISPDGFPVESTPMIAI